MDIRLPLINGLPLTSGSNTSDSISLQLNQLVEAKVIETATLQNTLTLQIGKQHVQVQNEPLLNLKPGQSLFLQVIKLVPVIEFQLQTNSKPTADPAASSPLIEQHNRLSLKVGSTTPNSVNPVPGQLVQGQRIELNLIQMTKNGIDVVFTTPATTQASQSKTPFNLSLEQLQLQQSVIASGKNITSFLQTKLGQTVSLEVIEGGQTPRFSILQTPPDGTPPPIEQQISNAIKQNLPLQQSPASLLQQITDILPTIQVNESIPEALKRLAQEILQTIPDKSTLSNPDNLQHQLMNSGRWLEAKLIQLIKNPDIELQQDFKLKILQLINQLKPEISAESKQEQTIQQLLTELLNKANSTLARIVLDQLNSLPREEGNKQSWLLELPVSYQEHIDNVRIEIELEKKSPDQNHKNRWSVNLTISPPDLGTIHCKLNCYDQQVSSHFLAEKAGTVNKIRNNLDRFKQSLLAQGINPGVIDVSVGALQDEKNTGNTPRGGLISEQA